MGQGCPLIPILFNRATVWNMGILLSPSVYIADLEFADDVFMPTDSPAAVHTILDRINLYAAKVGLEIRMNKTKAFPIPRAQQLPTNGKRIENVPPFKYLELVFRRMPTRITKLLQGWTTRVEDLCNFDKYYGHVVKSTYRQRSALLALQSSPHWPLRF